MGKIKNKEIKDKEETKVTRVQNNILGGMDYLVDRLVKSTELLKKRIEYLALVYTDETFLEEKFLEFPIEEIEYIKQSIETFPQEHTVEFCETLNQALKIVDKLHSILGKG